jgi:hypothetical protein
MSSDPKCHCLGWRPIRITYSTGWYLPRFVLIFEGSKRCNMEKPALSRREFVRNSMVLAAGFPVAASLQSFGNNDNHTDITANEKMLRWLDEKAPAFTGGTTWGVPWPKGTVFKAAGFVLQDAKGENIDVQSWPTAWWPDGSLKWSAHAIGAHTGLSDTLKLQSGKPVIPKKQIRLQEEGNTIEVDTGIIQCVIHKEGSTLVRSLMRNGKITAQDGRLVLLVQDHAEAEPGIPLNSEQYTSHIDKATVEQKGPVRVVVKIEGTHAHANGRQWLPFVLRLYLYEGSESIRIMHTMIYDGDEHKDFIRGIGIRFNVPMNDELHNRHIRFVGEGQGVFAEAVRGLTGLRREPGAPVRAAQLAGKVTPAIAANVAEGLQYIPAFGDYTLFQSTADAFEIQKRTKSGYGWIQSAFGHRAAGTGYLGSANGGLAFGIRNFWQSYPAQLDIRNAHTALAELTLWLWAPRAAAMDLRFYHDGMGQDTYAKQRDGLDITYEDYEPGFGTPKGVARTSELQIWVLAATPTNEELNQIAASIQQPPVVICSPADWQQAGVFGSCWGLPDNASAVKANMEKQLDWYFNFYRQQVEQRHWYGFWNYGDVMHSYDADRHVWKYDVGGFAWDNSELSTDLWLWYYFLHTGRNDVFRMAEAMTRHTGEVDVHHLGPFSPLGSRHNVQHWGCSAKQLRISTVANRRFYYYLTADERVGDLMREQVNAAETLRRIVPGRKVGQQPGDPLGAYAGVSFGTDWGALAAAWLTEWERTGDKAIMTRLLNSMQTIAQQPHGFFTGNGEMELTTGRFKKSQRSTVSVSHLSAVFGLAEICTELIDLVDMPAFENAWLQYCILYNATAEEQKAALGQSLSGTSLRQGHARLTAFAAQRKKDPQLAVRAWKEFFGNDNHLPPLPAVRQLTAPEVLNPVDEARSVSTNNTAQWGLTAIALLALIGNQAPEQ